MKADKRQFHSKAADRPEAARQFFQAPDDSEAMSLSRSMRDVVNEPGQLLSEESRKYFESRFEHNFSRVRVHSDFKAAESAKAASALAYTWADHLVFAGGQYSPATSTGRKLLAHELTHVIQNEQATGAPRPGDRINPTDSPTEQEAHRISYRLQRGLAAGRVTQVSQGISLTPTSAAITPLISYSMTDLAVTSSDETDVLRHLRADPDLSATVTDLNSAGRLGDLINRVDEDVNRRALLQLLGARLNAAATVLVMPHITRLGSQWELQFNLGRLGVSAAAPAFNPTPFASIVSSSQRTPFTGSGASGVDITTRDIPLAVQGLLAAGHAGTVAKYSNPIPGSLSAYLSTLTPAQRSQQGELLLRLPINTIDAASYAGNIPSRAQVISAAATAHNLHPQLVAAFLLAEQRDQSANEDAKDYLGARSRIMQGNTSIGLGQVVVSTARRSDLFADLLSSGTRTGLDHRAIAQLLASDEFNIFAAARYIRQTASLGATMSAAALPNTLGEFPGIDLPVYANNSSTWSEDNIGALGMYYTSRAWTDDIRSAGWGHFVVEAYHDVVASGVF